MNSFLQSREWADFQIKLSRDIFWLNKKLVIKYNLPLGMNYLYCPRPEFRNKEDFSDFIKEAKKIGVKEKSLFLKIEPAINENFDIENSIRPGSQKTRQVKIENLKFKIAKSAQPQDTLILNLDKSDDDLLSQMHSKTRYNIRLAQKHKIKIEQTTDPKKIDIFWELAIKTSARDSFSYHNKEYYQKMLEILGKNGMVKLFLAYKKLASQNQQLISVPIAAILVMFYKDQAIYLHGASNHNFRQFMAPYLLQWEAIKEAKKRKCLSYDFWGVKPKPLPHTPYTIHHPWDGITKFKTGFVPEGEFLHYPDALDLILKPFWYRIYRLIKLTRR
ncbi:MAG: aminoacyltransferase [Patescibacteria group bacterium]|nr:aminoacyltransferase [Patescibacteria group bacterium]